MKKYVLKGAGALMILCSSIAAGAQKDQNKKDEKQVIVITRDGDNNEKLNIEVSPDGKVLINGKEKNDNVSVNVTKIKDGAHVYSMAQGRGGQNWNFNLDNDRISLFSEDSNRAMLGITTDMNDKGAEVVTVNGESAAQKAGLKKGDIITRIGDKKIEDAEDVTKAVRSHKPGDQVAITVLRDGKEQRLTAKLDKYKGVFMRDFTPGRIFQVDGQPLIPSVPSAPLRGFTFNGGRPRLGLSIQDTDDGKGVKVLDVSEEGAAAKAGVKEGDVITHVDDKAVNSADEIIRNLRDTKDKSSVQLKLQRNGKTQNVEVKWPRKLKTADL